jgi:predicted acylesterase/phospholipase RssA
MEALMRIARPAAIAGVFLMLSGTLALGAATKSAAQGGPDYCTHYREDAKFLIFDLPSLPECAKRVKAKAQPRPPAVKPPPPAPKAQVLERPPFNAEDERLAVLPGMPNARFWADSEKDFLAALGHATMGPWLALSAGGEDSAFGAGLLTGLSETGRRPDYAVVTGVSSGALMAPYVFLGSGRDADLKNVFMEINAADVFEDRRTPESLFDTWPLRDFVAKRITPELLAAIAAEHRRGRRLIVLTTNLDSGRPVAWNMGAIAAAGGDAAVKLFRDVLLASSAIPGFFPPALIEVEANGKRFQEMHVDGGLAATVYLAPDSMLLNNSARLVPSQLTVIVNGKMAADFSVTDRSLAFILGRTLSLGVKRGTRTSVALIANAAERNGIDFELAAIEPGFEAASKGLFDAKYITALFDYGLRQGRSSAPFQRPAAQQSIRSQVRQ